MTSVKTEYVEGNTKFEPLPRVVIETQSKLANLSPLFRNTKQIWIRDEKHTKVKWWSYKSRATIEGSKGEKSTYLYCFKSFC